MDASFCDCVLPMDDPPQTAGRRSWRSPPSPVTQAPGFARSTAVNVSGSVNELTDGIVCSVDAPGEAEWLHIGNPDSGGLANEARDCSEDEVWSLGPHLWGSHRNDHRLGVGWRDDVQHDPDDDQRGGLGESGGDLRRPIYEATEP